jgi:superoxide dismutase
LIFVFDPVMPTGMQTKIKKAQKPSKQKISKRLVAAAPDLLGACWSILVTCEDMELDDIGALKDVRRALSRATGKTVRKLRR